jgi:hypothetical protein
MDTEWDNTNSIPPLIRVNLVLGGNNPILATTNAGRHPRHRRAVANHALRGAGFRRVWRQSQFRAQPRGSHRFPGEKMKIRRRHQSAGIALSS